MIKLLLMLRMQRPRHEGPFKSLLFLTVVVFFQGRDMLILFAFRSVIFDLDKIFFSSKYNYKVPSAYVRATSQKERDSEGNTMQEVGRCVIHSQFLHSYKQI